MAKPGRPKGSVKYPDELFYVWLLVNLARLSEKHRTGKRPSVSAICKMLCRGTGLNWLVGGDRQAVVAAIKDDPSRVDLRPKRLWETDVAVSGTISYAPTLRSRYVEADLLVRNSDNVRAAWTKMLNNMLDLVDLRGPSPAEGKT